MIQPITQYMIITPSPNVFNYLIDFSPSLKTETSSERFEQTSDDIIAIYKFLVYIRLLMN